MGKNIMVYIETADNSPINVSLEALTLAKKISKENNEQVMAVLIGENLDEAAKKCFDYGADEVLYVEENKKELEAVGNALIDVKEKYNPSVIFLGSTINGKDLANIVASKMKTPAFVDAVNVKYENQNFYKAEIMTKEDSNYTISSHGIDIKGLVLKVGTVSNSDLGIIEDMVVNLIEVSDKRITEDEARILYAQLLSDIKDDKLSNSIKYKNGITYAIQVERTGVLIFSAQ